MFKDLSWAKTDLGTPIALYAADEPTRFKKPIILIGGVHGDEPLGMELAEKTLSFLRKTHVPTPWVVIPNINPDGSRLGTRVNGRGVDLNRNYPSPSWQPGFEKPRYNPGPHAGSEAEIIALTKLIEATQPCLLIHCHSWKPMIVCAGEPGNRDAERLSRASGYKVVPEIGYSTPGSLSDYGWVDRKIPVICIEEADETPREKVWPNFEKGMTDIFLDASPR